MRPPFNESITVCREFLSPSSDAHEAFLFTMPSGQSAPYTSTRYCERVLLNSLALLLRPQYFLSILCQSTKCVARERAPCLPLKAKKNLDVHRDAGDTLASQGK